MKITEEEIERLYEVPVTGIKATRLANFMMGYLRKSSEYQTHETVRTIFWEKIQSLNAEYEEMKINTESNQ